MRLAAVFFLVCVAGCAGNLVSNPPVYQWHKEIVHAGNTQFHVTLAKPASASAPPWLVVFASGSGGLLGTSKAILQHLADEGYYVAGVSSREALRRVRGSGGQTQYATGRDVLATVIAGAKQAFGLPASTPVILTGMSQGAGLVVGASGDPNLHDGLAEVVAVALIGPSSYRIIAGQPTGLPGGTDERAASNAGAERQLGSIPFAIIQSTGDQYMPAAESRRLLGPDAWNRRLYPVEARNHSFGGGRTVLMRDLDDAMRWIVASRAASR